jgi:hypothetical protein
VTPTTVTAGNAGDAGSASELLSGELADGDAGEDEPLSVYGDAAYGAGEFLASLDAAGARSMCKVQPPTAAGGRFTKDAFSIDRTARTVTCPASQTAPLRRAGRDGLLRPGLRVLPAGRPVHHRQGRPHYLRRALRRTARGCRARQRDPDWAAEYRATRPKVERKIGHLMRRRHGGRRARVRGLAKVGADFALLAAAVNLARLSVLGLASHGGTREVNTS